MYREDEAQAELMQWTLQNTAQRVLGGWYPGTNIHGQALTIEDDDEE